MQRYLTNRVYYEVLSWVVLGSIVTLLNTLTTYDDHLRLAKTIELWQPFVWELSSQITGSLLIVLIIWFDKAYPLNGQRWKHNGIAHLLFTLVFSLLHVAGMVAIRKLVYLSMDQTYDFGDWSVEFIYEYRKDIVTYAFIIGVIYSYRFILSRLIGEATLIKEGEDSDESERPERFIVKKMGQQFIIKVADIEWIEASGNYMNLHVNGHVYPLRETMSKLERKLDPHQFVRIHRSIIVNIDWVKTIESLESGDYKAHLKNGRSVNFSRRYRESFQQFI